MMHSLACDPDHIHSKIQVAPEAFVRDAPSASLQARGASLSQSTQELSIPATRPQPPARS